MEKRNYENGGGISKREKRRKERKLREV